MIANPDKPTEQILEPLSKMTEGNKKQYTADVRVMNYLLQAIPNDIYNSVDALFHIAQQIIPAAQLVPKFQGIGRCNSYVVLQSIPCLPKCKIVGQILLNHPLSYALTGTADVPAVYLQQFWKIVHKLPDTEDTIIFKLDSQ
ncbi:hypothetical protein Tco_1001868 [Tanacetum coccineum]